MNIQLKILLIDNRVPESRIICDALTQSNVEVDCIDEILSATQYDFDRFDCVMVADTLFIQEHATHLPVSKFNLPIILLTANTDISINDRWKSFGITDVVNQAEINSLSIVRIIKSSIRIYKSEFRNRQLQQELCSQKKQIANQDQIIATQKQQINQKNIELIAASQLKSNFLTTISHELRTPIHVAQGFAQMLLRKQGGHLSSKQRDMVERINNNCQKLVVLLNEILDFDKLEAGTLDLQPQFFDVDFAIKSTVEEVTSLAQGKKLSLRVKNNLKNKIIYNDRMRIQQIAINLLSNAIKFTDSGCVCIELEDLPAEGFAIIVRDTGIGIDTSDVENIFDGFHQLDCKLSRKYSGIGLGLAVVNALVYMMQGRIIVSSQPGKGSTFRVEIPRQIATVPPNHESVRSHFHNIPNHQVAYSQQDVLLMRPRNLY